ncbi:hypothetical protein GW17_00027084, partial [Ensete ventricosum]
SDGRLEQQANGADDKRLSSVKSARYVSSITPCWLHLAAVDRCSTLGCEARLGAFASGICGPVGWFEDIASFSSGPIRGVRGECCVVVGVGCSHLGALSLMDAKATQTLEAMLQDQDRDTIITEPFLPKIRSRYHISFEYELHVPQVRQRPYDSFPNGFGLSFDALEVGLKFHYTRS